MVEAAGVESSRVFDIFREGAWHDAKFAKSNLRVHPSHRTVAAAPAWRGGTQIDYRIRVHGLPIGWRTKIIEWNPPDRFIDIQLRGPYALWRHMHVFEESDGGTLSTRSSYPRGGALMNWLFVQRDVEPFHVPPW